jgi:hypothetical protein
MGFPYLLTLFRRHAGSDFHLPQRAFALLWRKAVEFVQPVYQCCLAIRRQFLKIRLAFQKLLLLIGRQVFVLPEPVTGFVYG